MTDKTLTIGALARLTFTNPAVIRGYEQMGLLPPPARPMSVNGHASDTPDRMYGEWDVQRLIFLRRCRDLGVLNPQLHQLASLIDRPESAEGGARTYAEQLLANVQDHLEEVAGLEKTLAALIEGAGEPALALGEVDPVSKTGFKRMRRQVRKPLKTPSS